MRTIKLTLAYDGTRFVGWQRQAEGVSIQGLLEEAVAPLEGGPVTVHGAGRTDAGVHAMGQVASVQLACAHNPATIVRAVNAQLPPEVRVLAADEMPPGFHARFSATSKHYRYQIERAAIADPFRRAWAWHVPEPLDLAAMHAAAGLIAGTHDFAAFQSAGGTVTDTVRTITRSELCPGPSTSLGTGSTLTYEVVGTGFLRHMVRAIVGTLVEVGWGRRPAASVAALLDGGPRAAAGRTAPAQGLFLVSVDYD